MFLLRSNVSIFSFFFISFLGLIVLLLLLWQDRGGAAGGRHVRDDGGPEAGAAGGDGEHGPVAARAGLPGGQAGVLRLRRRVLPGDVLRSARGRRVRQALGAVLQEARRRRQGPLRLLLLLLLRRPTRARRRRRGRRQVPARLDGHEGLQLSSHAYRRTFTSVCTVSETVCSRPFP